MRVALALVVLTVAQPAWAHLGEVFFLGPDDDWCTAIQAGLAGDLFLMSPGDYYGPCDLIGQPEMYAGQKTSVESLDPQNPAVFHHDGLADYTLRLSGEGVVLRYVDLVDTPADAAAVDVIGPKHQIRGVLVDQHAGTAVRVVGDVFDFVMLENTVVDDLGVAFDLTCDACSVGAVEVMVNLVLNADVGLRVSGDADVLVRDNFIDAQTAAMDLSLSDTLPSLIENNYCVVPNGVGFAFAGGAYELRNNIVTAADPVVVTEPASSAVWVGNSLYGVNALDASNLGAGRVANNAVHPGATWPDGVDGGGNAVCADPASCWTDAAGQDFWPPSGSVLVTSGVPSLNDELTADWCGVPRASTPTSGALEAIAPVGFGPIEMVGRFYTDCSLPDVPPTTGTTSGTGTGTEPVEPPPTTPGEPEDPVVPDSGGCSVVGAAPAGVVSLGWWVLCGGLVARRRR